MLMVGDAIAIDCDGLPVDISRSSGQDDSLLFLAPFRKHHSRQGFPDDANHETHQETHPRQ